MIKVLLNNIKSMVLENFVKYTLMGIANGVKSANSEIKGESNKSSFALKNSTFFEDKKRGCIEFELFVDNREDTVHVKLQPIAEGGNRIKFYVAQVLPIS